MKYFNQKIKLLPVIIFLSNSHPKQLIVIKTITQQNHKNEIKQCWTLMWDVHCSIRQPIRSLIDTTNCSSCNMVTMVSMNWYWNWCDEIHCFDHNTQFISNDGFFFLFTNFALLKFFWIVFRHLADTFSFLKETSAKCLLFYYEYTPQSTFYNQI